MNKLLALLALSTLSLSAVATTSRIKDLVTVKGVRENALIGYGLVIGLNGTGDGGGEITNTSLKKMFQISLVVAQRVKNAVEPERSKKKMLARHVKERVSSTLVKHAVHP